MDREALEEEHRDWKLAQCEPGGGNYEVHGQGPPSPGVITSDFKGAVLIGTVISMLLSAQIFSNCLGIFSK